MGGAEGAGMCMCYGCVFDLRALAVRSRRHVTADLTTEQSPAVVASGLDDRSRLALLSRLVPRAAQSRHIAECLPSRASPVRSR